LQKGIEFRRKKVMYDNKYMTFVMIRMGVIKGKDDAYDRIEACTAGNCCRF